MRPSEAMMPPEAWKEYCWLKRRAEYLEQRHSSLYKYRKQEIDKAYEDVKDGCPPAVWSTDV